MIVPTDNINDDNLCPKHGIDVRPDGCIECKKELRLSMSKTQAIEIKGKSNYSYCPTPHEPCECFQDEGCRKMKNLNRTVPIAHFDYAGQSGSHPIRSTIPQPNVSTIDAGNDLPDDYRTHPALFLREGREFEVSLEEPTTFDQAAEMVAREIAGLIIKKQHDYGHDNIEAFGESGVIVRINDKVARLRNLIKSGKTPENEAIDDTYMDLAGYAFIALMLRRGWFKLELKDD